MDTLSSWALMCALAVFTIGMLTSTMSLLLKRGKAEDTLYRYGTWAMGVAVTVIALWLLGMGFVALIART